MLRSSKAAADAIEAGAGAVSGAAAGLGAAAFDDRSMCAGGGGGSSGSDGFVAAAAAPAPRFFFGASASALCANFGCPHLHVPKTAAVMSMRYSSHAAMAVWWSALPGESTTTETLPRLCATGIAARNVVRTNSYSLRIQPGRAAHGIFRACNTS